MLQLQLFSSHISPSKEDQCIKMSCVAFTSAEGSKSHNKDLVSGNTQKGQLRKTNTMISVSSTSKALCKLKRGMVQTYSYLCTIGNTLCLFRSNHKTSNLAQGIGHWTGYHKTYVVLSALALIRYVSPWTNLFHSLCT